MRVLSIFFTMILLFIVISVPGLAHAQTPGPVYDVSTQKSYQTIQEAIDDASLGDIIQVNSGTYNGSIVVNKQLTLIGEDTGAGQPIIYGNGTANNNTIGIRITANGVMVQGFNVTNSFAGILVGGSNNNVTGNTANNNCNGISLTDSTNSNVTGNTINNNSNGIALIYSTNSNVTGNTANNNGNGIYLYGSINNNNLAENMANNNTINGIFLYASTNDTVIGNTVNNNQYGIVLGGSRYNNVTWNTANNNTYAGIAVDDASFNNVLWLNVLRGNRQNVLGGGSPNLWNSTAPVSYSYDGHIYTNYTGNYWGDYTAAGEYLGIGYPPYNINTRSIDYYPMILTPSQIPASTPTPTPNTTMTPSIPALITIIIIGIVGYCITNKK